MAPRQPFPFWNLTLLSSCHSSGCPEVNGLPNFLLVAPIWIVFDPFYSLLMEFTSTCAWCTAEQPEIYSEPASDDPFDTDIALSATKRTVANPLYQVAGHPMSLQPDDDLVGGDSPGSHSDSEDSSSSAELLAVYRRIRNRDCVSGGSLLDLYNEAYAAADSTKYCYLRCLLPVDAEKFRVKLVQMLMANCADHEVRKGAVTAGTMRMLVWRRVMEQLALTGTYKLWRPTLWGEGPDQAPTTRVESGYYLLLLTFQSSEPGSREYNLLHRPGHLQSVGVAFLRSTACQDQRHTDKLWRDIVCGRRPAEVLGSLPRVISDHEEIAERGEGPVAVLKARKAGTYEDEDGNA